MSTSDNKSISSLLATTALLIGAFYAYGTISPIGDALRVENWKKVPAVVVSTKTTDTPKGPSTSVRYEHEFEGKTYHSHRFAFSERISRIDFLTEKQQLNIGDKIEVYVEPSDPTLATVKTDFPFNVALMLAISTLFIVGACFVLTRNLLAKTGSSKGTNT